MVIGLDDAVIFGTIAAAGAAAGGVGGSMISADASQNMSWQGFLNNAWLQQQNMDWQERMSSTAHQREVADLKAAGLNPLLSVNGGASVGNVSASASPIDSQRGNALAQTLSTAAQLIAQIGMQKAQINNLQANAALAGQQALTQETTRDLQISQINLNNAEKILKDKDASWYDRRIAEQIKNISAQTMLHNANTAKANAETTESKARTQNYKSQTWRNYNMPLGTQEILNEIGGNDNWNIGAKGGIGGSINKLINGTIGIDGNKSHGKHSTTRYLIRR